MFVVKSGRKLKSLLLSVSINSILFGFMPMFCLHFHRLPVAASSIADSMVSLTSSLIAASSSLGTAGTISSCAKKHLGACMRFHC